MKSLGRIGSNDFYNAVKKKRTYEGFCLTKLIKRKIKISNHFNIVPPEDLTSWPVHLKSERPLMTNFLLINIKFGTCEMRRCNWGYLQVDSGLIVKSKCRCLFCVGLQPNTEDVDMAKNRNEPQIWQYKNHQHSGRLSKTYLRHANKKKLLLISFTE